MKALVYYGNKDIRLEQNWPDPKLKNDDDAILKINFTGICATDIEEWQYGPLWMQSGEKNTYSGRMIPLIPGHEITGQIIELGKNVKGLTLGDRVVVNNVIHCNKCFWCLNGQGGGCSGMCVAGFMDDGGLAEFMRWPASHLIKISDNVPSENAPFMEPTMVACHAVRKSGIKPGDKVSVLGCGTVGLLTLQVLKASGAEVTAIDVRDESLELAKSMGANFTFNSSKSNIVESLLSVTDGVGHDIVFETAGAAETPRMAINYTRKGGKTILVGIYSSEPKMDFNEIVNFEREVIGSVAASPGDMETAVYLLNEGKIDPSSLISAVVPLDKVIHDGYARMNKSSKDVLRVLEGS